MDEHDGTVSGPGLRVLVTGATGFIGTGLVPALAAAGHRVRIAVRTPRTPPEGIESAIIGDLRRPVNLAEAMAGVDAVIHAAALAHTGPGLPDSDYDSLNTEATAALARAAARAGVRRFVFLSSVRAQCGASSPGIVTEADPPAPTDAYGRSKLAAEAALAGIDLPAVILRPVLVHGPGVRFNMAALIRLAASPLPLPFGLFRAPRSVVARDHLADAVRLALENDAMTGRTYLVADPEPLTVGEMVASLRTGFGRSRRLLPVPPGMVEAAARLLGRADEIARLNQPLVADPAQLLAAGWRPRRSAADALAETGRQIAAGR